MNCFSGLQNDLYHDILYPCGCTEGQACVQNSFLPARRLQQLPGDDPKRGSQRVQPTREQRPCCCSGAPISPGAVPWGSEGSSEFLPTAPNQVSNCWYRVAQNSSILVPFWEKQGQCWFGIIQIAENRSISKTYFIYSRWQCKSCHSKRSFLHKNLFYSLPSFLHPTA